ncbi:MAG: diaminopimelate decarboxylase [Alphaproteobacteria bacterium]
MNHFDYVNGELCAEGVPLSRIAAEVGTPVYCYSTATLVHHYRVFAEAFASQKATICYAVKANANLAVIRTLAELGAGADVLSEGELVRALAAGVPADKIVFSGIGKSANEIALALDSGISQINIESEPELEAVNEIAVAKGLRAPIAIRVNPDIDPITHEKITTGMKENKFGIDFQDAPGLYQRAAALPGIEVVGTAVHIGSQLTDLAPFAEAFRLVAELVTELKAKGIAIRRVDLGGGLGIPYRDEVPPTPRAYAEMVEGATKGLDCEIVLEPGRLLVGNAGVLVTRVLYVKQGSSKTFVIVDAAMNDLMRPTLYDAYHEITPVRAPESGKTGKDMVADVVGPVCESGDYFAKDRPLTVLQSDDLLAIRSAGAYGAAMASGYNSRPLVAEVLVKDDAFAVIRPRQTHQEALAQERMPDWLGDAPDAAAMSLASKDVA